MAEDVKPAEEQVEEKAEKRAKPDPKKVARAQVLVQHAFDHGLNPGEAYDLHVHDEPRPFQGRLMGSNEHGILFKSDGARGHSFHPYGSFKMLVHQPAEEE